METIYVNDNAVAVINKVTANIEEQGESVNVSDSSSATELVTALNGVFEGVEGAVELSQSDNAADFVEDLNDNFAALENSAASFKMSFLHASDPHGSTAFTTKMSNDMAMDDEIVFSLISGDFKAYGTNSPLLYYDAANDTGALKNVMRWGVVLGTSGNHDSYDMWSDGDGITNSRMKNWLYDLMGDSVIWGDTDGQTNEPLQSAYYYKDFTKEGHTLRVIALDQYEIDAVGGATNRYYYQRYSQKQLNWFINLLKTTPSAYHIVVVMHQPPFDDNDYVSEIKPSPDTVGGSTYINTPTRLLFCSEKMGTGAFREYSAIPWMNTIVNIVKAYLGFDGASRTYTEQFQNIGSTAFSLSADFTGVTPAIFCGYVFGHLHCDIATWLPYSSYGENKELYPRQLILGITAADRDVPLAGGDDLNDATVNTTYRINKVTIEFGSEGRDSSVVVERIGTRLTDGGRNRHKVRYWLNASQTVQDLS